MGLPCHQTLTLVQHTCSLTSYQFLTTLPEGAFLISPMINGLSWYIFMRNWFYFKILGHYHSCHLAFRKAFLSQWLYCWSFHNFMSCLYSTCFFFFFPFSFYHIGFFPKNNLPNCCIGCIGQVASVLRVKLRKRLVSPLIK